MGLDVVEVFLRTEEVFGITIADEDAERALTVGGLYELVCKQLHVPTARPSGTGTSGPIGKARLYEPPLIPVRFITPPPAVLPTSEPPWTPEDVWATLVALVVDQLQVDESEVRYDASWANDLGAD